MYNAWQLREGEERQNPCEEQEVERISSAHCVTPMDLK